MLYKCCVAQNIETVVMNEIDQTSTNQSTEVTQFAIVSEEKRSEPTQQSTSKDTMLEQLLQTKVTELRSFCQSKMNRDIVEDPEQLIELCKIVQNDNNNTFHLATLLIILAVHCTHHVETLMHPKKWMHVMIQKIWAEEMIAVTSTQMTSLLTELRKNLKTSYTNMLVRHIHLACLVPQKLSPPSLYQIDLIESIDVFKKLKLLLTDSHLNTGTSTLVTDIISTYPISAPTQTNVVEVLGSDGPLRGQSSGNDDFGALLKQSTYNQPTASEYLETYIKDLDTSTEMVASQKMEDYVIDINMYRKEDIKDKEKGEYWMGAEIRARGTFSVKNPIVNQTKDIVKAMAAEIHLTPNSKVQKKEKNSLTWNSPR